METFIDKGIEYTINYQPTKLGDKILIKGTCNFYIASTFDVDDLNWIVINIKHVL